MAGFPSRGMHPQIADLLRYAAEVASGEPLPSRHRLQIDYARRDVLLPHIFFVEVCEGGDDYGRYPGGIRPAMDDLNLCGHVLSGDLFARQSGVEHAADQAFGK